MVGPTGSGKSTLGAWFRGSRTPRRGWCWIDGRPIREYPLEMLRAKIGFVPQETFLFSKRFATTLRLARRGDA